ncbi:MAG: protein-L-isoaspartate(D-aspartate) O-methyltransferase [Deltaproteobacteria bacterium]|nr:protein-L-isoaspartate(D-aspartate) O-methyltransferase [Deltaproteobacteria bacterium]
MKRIWKIALYSLVIGIVLLGISKKSRSSSPVVDDERFASMRKSMVDQQIKRRGVNDRDVLDAMLSVPRHLFVPEKSMYRAYNDSPLPIGYGQTISQPYIVAYMTEILNLDKDSVVLEVGTGSGYQAAILSVLVKKVYTIEIIPELAASASERLQRLEYNNIEVKNGDGYYGWPERAPFDAIIVTAAAGHVPPPLIEQLKNGGRMIIPVGGAFMTQSLVLVIKDETGNITTQNIMPVIFVPLTGDHK